MRQHSFAAISAARSSALSLVQDDAAPFALRRDDYLALRRGADPDSLTHWQAQCNRIHAWTYLWLRTTHTYGDVNASDIAGDAFVEWYTDFLKLVATDRIEYGAETQPLVRASVGDAAKLTPFDDWVRCQLKKLCGRAARALRRQTRQLGGSLEAAANVGREPPGPIEQRPDVAVALTVDQEAASRAVTRLAAWANELNIKRLLGCLDSYHRALGQLAKQARTQRQVLESGIALLRGALMSWHRRRAAPLNEKHPDRLRERLPTLSADDLAMFAPPSAGGLYILYRRRHFAEAFASGRARDPALTAQIFEKRLRAGFDKATERLRHGQNALIPPPEFLLTALEVPRRLEGISAAQADRVLREVRAAHPDAEMDWETVCAEQATSMLVTVRACAPQIETMVEAVAVAFGHLRPYVRRHREKKAVMAELEVWVP